MKTYEEELIIYPTVSLVVAMDREDYARKQAATNEFVCPECGTKYNLSVYKTCPLCESRKKNSELEVYIEKINKMPVQGNDVAGTKQGSMQKERKSEQKANTKTSSSTKDNAEEVRDDSKTEYRELYNIQFSKRFSTIIRAVEVIGMLILMSISGVNYYLLTSSVADKWLFIFLWYLLPCLSAFIFYMSSDNCWNMIIGITYLVFQNCSFNITEIINDGYGKPVYIWMKLFSFYFQLVAFFFMCAVWDDFGRRKKGVVRDLMQFVLPWELVAIVLNVLTFNPVLEQLRKIFMWIPLNK